MKRKQSRSPPCRRFRYVILIMIKFGELLLWISRRIINAWRSDIKHSKDCFIRYPNTSKLVNKSRLPRFFNPLHSVLISDETLFLEFDILHRILLIYQVDSNLSMRWCPPSFQKVRPRQWNIIMNCATLESLSHFHQRGPSLSKALAKRFKLVLSNIVKHPNARSCGPRNHLEYHYNFNMAESAIMHLACASQTCFMHLAKRTKWWEQKKCLMLFDRMVDGVQTRWNIIKHHQTSSNKVSKL